MPCDTPSSLSLMYTVNKENTHALLYLLQYILGQGAWWFWVIQAHNKCTCHFTVYFSISLYCSYLQSYHSFCHKHTSGMYMHYYCESLYDCIIIISVKYNFTIYLSTVSRGQEPEYEDPDAIVSSLAATSPAPLPRQGPDAENSTITIVPSWVSYINTLPTTSPLSVWLLIYWSELWLSIWNKDGCDWVITHNELQNHYIPSS